MKTFRATTVLAILAGLLIVPLPAFAAPTAQGALLVTAIAAATCGEAQFSIEVTGGVAPYEVTVSFGDGETQAAAGDGITPIVVTHAYAVGGSFDWSVTVTSGDLAGQAAGTLAIGPSVTLTSEPFPPLLSLAEGGASVTFTAEASGGSAPYTYAWMLEGAGASTSDPSSPTASATYGSGGKYVAVVAVTDACGLTAEDSLPIVVDDPLAEGCHPAAESIANAINTLFPLQAGTLYTCEDIYGFFTGGLTGSQLGFGPMRHAYALAEAIPDLTWEEILDWKLGGTGWGLLTQLDRIDEALDEVGIAELIERLVTGENSIGDIRTAARMAVRYDAEFAGALDLLAGGASNGELGQIYRAAQELGVDPAVVAGYEDLGIRAVELQEAARVAERLGTDWASVVEAHAAGESWGSIRKGDDGAAHGNGQGNGQGGDAGGEEIRNEVNLRVAEQLAAKYGLTIEAVQAMYGTCGGDWVCVRATLRELQGHGKPKDK